MRQAFFMLGLSALSWTATAQQQSGNITSDYRISAFANSQYLQPLKRADAGTRDKVAAQFPGWYIETDKWTGGFKEINGKPITVSGSSLEAKARNCMDKQLSGLGVTSGEWKLAGQNTDKKGNSYLYFVQQIDGHSVAFAKMNFKFTADQKLGRISMRGFGSADTKLTPSIAKEDVLNAASADLSSLTVVSKSVAAAWSWFPVPSAKGYNLRPAYTFTIEAYNANDPKATPLALTGYVDAISGELLYRDNEVRDIVDLKVKGTVYKNGKLSPATDEPLADLAVTLNADPTVYYTDTSGFFSGGSATLPDTAKMGLKGRYCTVFAIASGSVTPTTSTVVTSLGSDFVFPVATPSSSRHVNAYYHVTRVHDFMKEHMPTFPSMDSPLPTNVDVAGSCNAFYSPAAYSINFYAANSLCNSFAEIGDIIYHEYGHGISDKFYTFSGVASMRNGAMNEGNSDIWAISITGNPLLGEGSYVAGGGLIRRYDLDPKVYPKDIQGEVHADGEIIAGAWWDVAVNTGGNVKFMGDLFTSTYYDTPDGPNGMEGDVYHEVLLSALTQDDDDGDLKTGTPHFSEIVRAFARHGIYFLSDIVVDHKELTNQTAKTPIKFEANVTLSTPDFFFQGLLLNYRVRGGAWDSLSMANVGGGKFTAELPGKDAGTIMDYYITVQDVLSTNGVFIPGNYYPSMSATQTTLPYQFAVGVKEMAKESFETTLTDWQLGLPTDNATTGKWIQAVPVPSRTSAAAGSVLCQTGNDHTTGTGQCLVTGNAATTTANVTSACVKNGTTTVNSPIFDLTGYSKAIIEYYRWFGNDLGNFRRKDNWQVTISDKDGVFWTPIDNTYQSDYNWRKRVVAVSDYLLSTTTFQLRFIAKNIVSSTTGNAVVEAAVDDFVLYDKNDITGIDETGKKQLANIYPNPADQFITVVLPGGVKVGTIEFYDLTGKLISQVEISPATTTYHIGTQQLVPGQYMMVVKMDKTIQTRTVTITHQ